MQNMQNQYQAKSLKDFAVTMNIEEAKTKVRELLGFMRSAPSFKINNTITEFVTKFAEFIKGGDSDNAIRQAGQLLSVGRSIFGKYLRNSVVDHEETKNEKSFTVEAHFNRIIRLKTEQCYDEDLVGQLKAGHAKLLTAVSEEKDGDFSRRIAAYTEMVTLVDGIDDLQFARDEAARDAAEKAKKLAKKGRQAAEDAAATERNKQRDQSARQRLLAQREQEADEFLSFVK